MAAEFLGSTSSRGSTPRDCIKSSGAGFVTVGRTGRGYILVKSCYQDLRLYAEPYSLLRYWHRTWPPWGTSLCTFEEHEQGISMISWPACLMFGSGLPRELHLAAFSQQTGRSLSQQRPEFCLTFLVLSWYQGLGILLPHS